MAAPDASRSIIVTGAGGFVGRYVVDALRAAGVEQDRIVATHLAGETPPEGVAAAVCDITDREALAELSQTRRPAAVVHLAAIAAPADARANHDLAWRVNFDAVRHLGEALIAHAPGARLIFASSSETYGASFNAVDGAITEDAPLRPMTTYAATKAAADILVGQLGHEGLSTVRFRAFNHAGPGQTPAFVVPAFASQLAEVMAGRSEPVLRVGDLTARRDFLDVRDVARAYALAALADLPDGPHVFNLASGEARSIASILDALIALSGLDLRVETDPARLRPSDVPITLGDASRAASGLCWRPEIPFDQTLEQTLAHFARRAQE